MTLIVQLLGKAEIRHDNKIIKVKGQKALALLAYLLVTGQAHTRQHLMDLFFDEAADPRASLRWLLNQLRQKLGPDYFQADRQQIGFNCDLDYRLDIDALLAGDTGVYRGDFLEGAYLRDAQGFMEWAFFERERLRECYQRTLAGHLEESERQGDYQAVVTLAQRLIQLDNLPEAWHRALMQAYALLGQREAALAQYEQCREVLDTEFGVEPEEATTALYEQIKTDTLVDPRSLADLPVRLPSFLQKEEIKVETGSSVFVTRGQELARLDQFLHQALAGRGQVVFIAGGAGRGKTALLNEFARRAHAAQADLLVAVGNCDAYAGIGDPYLPFREIMAMLTGDVDAPFAAGTITVEHARGLWGGLLATCQALLDYGQNLIDVLVPRQALFHRVQTAVPQGIYELAHLRRLAELPQPTTELTQEHIFQQVVNVLQNLSTRHPVLLLLDDLQWADETSLSLLVHLGRRLAGHRILIVGAYRPEEVAIGRGGTRHPLEKVLTEFKRSFGQDWIDLSQTSKSEAQHFVDSFLDIEPNQFSQKFRQTLYRHTEGHPLFTVELLRHMQERGDLVQNEQGYWLAGPQLNWQALPVRVEAVIEERIGRLQEELRQVLTVASINGEEFLAQVLARVQDTNERHLLRQLSQVLAKQHRLVKERGEISVGDQVLSRYRFVHVLFQRYLYNELSPGERRLLHGEIGAILEMLYSDQVGEIAVQLAWHFQEGNIPEKTRQYMQLAGEQAARQYANDEAVIYLSRALEMWPESAYSERYKLLMVRERVYDLQGARESQDQDLTSLQSLAGTLIDDQKRAAVALRRANYAEATSDYPAAIKAAREAIDRAEVVESTTVEIRGYLRWGWTLSMQGHFEEAKPLVERALLLAKGTPQESRALANLGIFSAEQDDLNRAKSYFEQALLICRQSGNQQLEGSMLNNLGIVVGMQGDYTQAKTYYEQALLLKRKIGDRRGEAMVLDNFGDAFIFLGDYTQAKLYLEQALFITREINNRKEGGNILYNLGNISHCQGDCIKARAYYEQALHLRREIGDCEGQAEVLAYLSLLFHHLGEDRAALEYSQQAMQIAQDVGSQHFLGYALTHRGHGLAGLGQLAEASEAYHKAVTIRRKAGADNRATEPLAGLAQVSLIQGNLQQAKDQVEEILNHLETGTLDGTEEPFRIYLTCYRVLQADQDPRAETILAISYQQLQERAAKITDDEMRVSFLKNVAAHREIVTEFEK